MKTKIIPFDLETAKKIQAGEIEGKIKTIDGHDARIICWDRVDKYAGSIIALYRDEKMNELPLFCNDTGKEAFSSIDIVLEVPDNEPQFKPFDKVLVTQNGWDYWIPSLYRNETPDGKHICIDNLEYDYCIPYEGNEHLVGTINKPKEE